MPKDILDILDTAIKIGLGALVSGVTTYMVTHKNNLHERLKNIESKKISIIEYATENIEPYLSALALIMSRIDGILKLGNTPGKTTSEKIENYSLYKYDNELIQTREKRSVAISRLKLIGINEPVDKLQNIIDSENEFRRQLLFDQIIPNKEELATYKKDFEYAQKDFYNSMQKSFISIYN